MPRRHYGGVHTRCGPGSDSAPFSFWAHFLYPCNLCIRNVSLEHMLTVPEYGWTFLALCLRFQSLLNVMCSLHLTSPTKPHLPCHLLWEVLLIPQATISLPGTIATQYFVPALSKPCVSVSPTAVLWPLSVCPLQLTAQVLWPHRFNSISVPQIILTFLLQRQIHSVPRGL